MKFSDYREEKKREPEYVKELRKMNGGYKHLKAKDILNLEGLKKIINRMRSAF